MRLRLTERLHSGGVRLTAQRRVIADALDGENRHLSADDVLAAAQAELPEIGRATVYKALAAFVAAGEVREVRVDDGPAMFDPNGNFAHDHFVCLSCERIWDVPTQAVPAIPTGFSVERTEITHFGACHGCTPN